MRATSFGQLAITEQDVLLHHRPIRTGNVSCSIGRPEDSYAWVTPACEVHTSFDSVNESLFGHRTVYEIKKEHTFFSSIQSHGPPNIPTIHTAISDARPTPTGAASTTPIHSFRQGCRHDHAPALGHCSRLPPQRELAHVDKQGREEPYALATSFPPPTDSRRHHSAS